MTFRECVLKCAANMELVKEFDRLRGTNLCRKGAPIEQAVDDATGRYEQDAIQFINFVYDVFWLRLSDNVLEAIPSEGEKNEP